MINIKAKNRRPIPAVYAATRIIEASYPFKEQCFPDSRTGSAPYRIGWGRSIGKEDKEVVANKTDEHAWLLGEMENIYHTVDRSYSYEEKVNVMITRFLNTH